MYDIFCSNLRLFFLAQFREHRTNEFEFPNISPTCFSMVISFIETDLTLNSDPQVPRIVFQFSLSPNDVMVSALI